MGGRGKGRQFGWVVASSGLGCLDEFAPRSLKELRFGPRAAWPTKLAWPLQAGIGGEEQGTVAKSKGRT